MGLIPRGLSLYLLLSASICGYAHKFIASSLDKIDESVYSSIWTGTGACPYGSYTQGTCPYICFYLRPSVDMLTKNARPGRG